MKLLLVLGLFANIERAVFDENTTYGVGTTSCGTYTESRRNHTDLVYKHWIGGYLTAADQFSNVSEAADLQGLMSFLDNYCREHPLEHFYEAADALRMEMTPPPPGAPPPQP